MKYFAYTDGSYMEDPEFGPYFGYSFVLVQEGDTRMHQVAGSGNDHPYIEMHNVAGELTAVQMLCQYCIDVLKLGRDDELIIHHDYEGIDKWLRPAGSEGFWRAKKPATQMYRDYMNAYVKTRFKVTFVWTRGHSGNAGNELADKLARQALKDKFGALRLLNEM